MNIPKKPLLMVLPAIQALPSSGLPFSEALQGALDGLQMLRREAQAIVGGYQAPGLVEAEGTILLRVSRGKTFTHHHLEVSDHHYRWDVDGDHFVKCIEQKGWLTSGAGRLARLLGACERFLTRWMADMKAGTVTGAPSHEGDATALLDALTGGAYLAYYRTGLPGNTTTHAETAGQTLPEQAEQIRSMARRVRDTQAKALVARQRAAGAFDQRTVEIGEKLVHEMLDRYAAEPSPAGAP